MTSSVTPVLLTHMSVSKEALIKEKVRVNTPLDYWGYTNSLRYHMYRFYTYRNCPNKMDPDVAECPKRSIQE